MNFLYKDNIYSVKKIMFFVLISCIPGIVAKFYFFGNAVLIQIFLFIVISLLLEIMILKIRCKSIQINISDNSCLVTAVLLGVSVPSLLPWWMIIIAVFFSIVVAKHLYGGIGQNIFNPAMLGYAVLLISFPLYMNNWSEKNVNLSFINNLKNSWNIILFQKHINSIHEYEKNIFFENYTEATPLDNFKTQSHLKHNYLSENILFKNQDIIIKKSWKYINISFLLGGIILIFQNIICWRIPLSFLTTLGICSSISYFYSQDLFVSPLIHLFSGGTMICAFFISTDPVTSPCTNMGKIIFGIIIGVLVWTIRNYSDYPDGISFSVLFANMSVPLIDHYIKTSGYGHHKNEKS